MLNLLHSQLALFGEIDKEVVAAKRGNTTSDIAVLETVEKLLPGTTGFGQAGWYDELRTFLDRHKPPARTAPVEFPGFPDAVRYLLAPPAERILPGNSSGEAAPIIERTDVYDPARDPVLARSVYAAVVLDKIRDLKRGPKSAELTALFETLLPTVLESWVDTGTDDPSINSTTASKAATTLTDRIAEISDAQTYLQVVGEVVGTEFAERSKPCFGTLEVVDGQYCSTVYTDSDEPKLSVADIEQIIDPRNWTLCCKFFHKVEEQDPHYTKMGWTRILETISPEPDDYLLSTALIFYYGKNDGGIYLNYEVDPTRHGDSGVVEVDNGYIWVTPLGGRGLDDPGVRIRTSKQERVNGLSPTATAAIACLLGWADVGREVLAGTAEKLIAGKISPKKLEPFVPSPAPNFEHSVVADTGSGQASAALAKHEAELPRNAKDVVDDTATLVKDLIARAANVGGDATKRWLDGMERDDVAAITKNVGDKLAESAMQAWSVAERNVTPPPEAPSDGDANG